MANTKLLYSLLIAGMTLGTAWSIRGQFGHEQGAAWAGAIGGISIILLAKRSDWYAKVFKAALASAVGWGVGGMISYGMVVGYGRGIDFGNVYYGLTMLFVIGGLFGILGGGLFGLALASNKVKPVFWPSLLVEMAVGGLIFYHFFIDQLGWRMTPPRSEAWAACLGMSVAMFWNLLRQKQQAPLRVAVYAGFGAGFGFAFGNFLQVMGAVSQIPFNFWNVMEYSIGFFGGVGMAYGTFTSKWEPTPPIVRRNSLLTPLVILVLFIPFIVWEQSFNVERLSNNLLEINYIGDSGDMVLLIIWGALILFLFTGIYWLVRFFLKPGEPQISLNYHDVFSFFIGHSLLYALFSLLITCAFLSLYRMEQYLYFVNLAVIFLLIGRLQPSFTNKGIPIRRWIIGFLFVMIVIAFLAMVAIHSHEGLMGANKRFE